MVGNRSIMVLINELFACPNLACLSVCASLEEAFGPFYSTIRILCFTVHTMYNHYGAAYFRGVADAQLHMRTYSAAIAEFIR